MKRPLTIALAQLDYTLADFAGNARRMGEAVRRTSAADLIVFSELALSGYYPQDLIEDPTFLRRHDEALASLLELSQEVRATLVAGAVTRNTGIGKPFHNSLLAIRDGAIVLTYNKQLLPTYDIFDEHRHFEPGADHAAFIELKGWRIGFLICEDGWSDGRRDDARNPFATLADAGADLVVSINASPSTVGKAAQREAIFAAASRRHRLPVVYVNQVGGNDQIVGDGASFLVTPEAGVVHRLPDFAEAVESLVFDGGFSAAGRRCEALPPPAPADVEFYYRQIRLGLRDYVGKLGFPGVVVGASGGLDSALTLALATDALRPERVRAITMPSPYSSRGSVDDSRALCRKLGIVLHVHPIDELFDGFRTRFAGAFAATPSALTQENVQARIRGTILMEYSNHFGHLVLSTGNKSEMSVGYSTLYGDMNGGLAPIGDLYRTEVFELARHYNARHGSELIPAAIIDKPPSAELAADQKDSDRLPPYPVLDEILKLEIDGPRLRPEEWQRAQAFVADLGARGDAAVVDRVRRLVARAEFKRRQAPPIIRVRARAFGNGRHMPIAARF